MNSLSVRFEVLCAGLLLIVGAVFLAATFMADTARAAAVSATTLTATSTNAYVNSGFATTSRVTTGDQVNFRLTTSGTPLIAPQINIFTMGSTTMSGSGTNWSYSTTAPATAWTQGPITWRIGIGGTVGDATTTVTHANITSGNNVTYDIAAPTLSSVSWSDVDSSTQISATDTLAFTFSETMATTTLTGADLNTVLALSGSHTFSTTTAPSWNAAGTILTVTLGTATDVAHGDTVDPTSAVRDSVGIADATASAVTITDNVAPRPPTGLADDARTGSIQIVLASVGSTDIHYTTDGSTPTCTTGTTYSGEFTLAQTATVKAVGCDEADNTSSVASASYTISVGSGGGSSARSRVARNNEPATPATPAAQEEGCRSGATFNTQTGKSCTTPATPSSRALANASANASFNRDLSTGSQGDDVRALQVWLNTHGYVIATTGPGSPGNETTFFGAFTKAAVMKYQQAKGITPAAGYVGPKTRAALSAEL